MPIVLYYKGLLSEFSPDLPRIGPSEELRFYSDYPQERSLRTWFQLYSRFPQSPESAEARWRLAVRLAGQKELPKARAFLDEAEAMVGEQLAIPETGPSAPDDSLFSAFRPSARTVMTPMKLRDLQERIYELRTLIGEENLAGAEGTLARLAEFVLLNPCGLGYDGQLDALLARAGPKDELRDNLLLEKAKLIDDDQGRAERLSELSRQYQNTDGGMQALYELTRLNIRLYQREPKKERLLLARDMLTNFLSLYPESFYAVQVKKNLEDLPGPD
jgi:hypothetical protein